MRLHWIFGVLLASALSVPASAQIGIYIGSAPPPLRIERRGPMPGEGYAWVDGYWAPNGGHYRWVAGRWDRPPYEGAVWSHAHYDHQRQGWQLHEGHWDHADNGHDHGH
jgi:WXXGXW repeat (2 copies)